METGIAVAPKLVLNPYLDMVLKLKRGPDGVECDPEDCMASGQDGYIHFSIVTTIGEEAAWWAVGHDHAVPAAVSVQLLRPAHVGEGTLLGKGCALRLGKSIIVSEAVVTQGMKTICKVTANFVHFYHKQPVNLWRAQQGRHGL